MKKDNILVLGAGGQIGTVLTKTLRQYYGDRRIIAADLRMPHNHDGPFETIDALDAKAISEVVKKHRITQIYHLVAVLSASGERDPMRAWEVNMHSFFNVLQIARERRLSKVFFPSSIAVFGQQAARERTPQYEVLIPDTVYGISKVAGENWAYYFFQKYGLDVRSLRYPGIIGHQSMPGGGTTDYAVEIYHFAVKNQPFTCFLSENTRLPMLYMDDAVRATVELMEAPAQNLTVRTSYNIAGMSFSPAEITACIRKYKPHFQVSFQPDYRQAIAETWPQSIDDSFARNDWGWQARFDLDTMTQDMFYHLTSKNT